MNFAGVVGQLAWANRRRRGKEKFSSDKCVNSIPKVREGITNISSVRLTRRDVSMSIVYINSNYYQLEECQIREA